MQTTKGSFHNLAALVSGEGLSGPAALDANGRAGPGRGGLGGSRLSSDKPLPVHPEAPRPTRYATHISALVTPCSPI